MRAEQALPSVPSVGADHQTVKTFLLDEVMNVSGYSTDAHMAFRTRLLSAWQIMLRHQSRKLFLRFGDRICFEIASKFSFESRVDGVSDG